MKKIFSSGLIAGLVLLIISIFGLYLTVWLFPNLSLEYFDPAFDTEPGKALLYYIHPFVIGLALSWFWSRFKSVLTGSFITRGVEFGLIYSLVASFPMLWLIYSAMNVSIAMLATWFILAVAQGIVSGLVFEKTNP